MRPELLARLAAASAARAQAGLLRRLHTVEARRGTQVWIKGRALIDFCSNDYLGLAQHPALITALQQAASEGVGSTAAHLISGHHREHATLQETLAEWTGRERALLFSTGTMANVGVLQALLGQGDLCVQDKRNHASLIDGALAAGAILRRYPHADVAAASRQLATRPQAAALLASDGVFSMDGDSAPLPELVAACTQQAATLMIDDAHGLGVLGHEGAGSVRAAGLDQQLVPVLMATLGKALGCSGAFVAGSAALIDGLTQFARSYLYTTAMPPALAAAARAAVDITRREAWRREHLVALIGQFRRGASQLGLPLLASTTPIQPLLLGDAKTTLDASEALQNAGFLVIAIRPPTVTQNQSRLRITLRATHTEAEVDRLLGALSQALHRQH